MMEKKLKLLLPSVLACLQPFAPLLLVLLSAVVAVGAFLQALDYPFVFDDKVYIILNAKLSGLNPSELWRLFTEPYNLLREFLPLRELSYWFDMKVFGLSPSVFRSHNIFLYFLCLPLVYGTTACLWRYFRPADADSAPWAAAVVTALFSLHPALVEPVVWVSGRKYILANLFSMLAFWFALHVRREQGFSVPYALATMVAFVAVMLSKTSYVPVAPIIVMLWVMFWLDLPVLRRRPAQLLWPLTILALALLLLSVFIASSVGTVPVYFGIETITRALAILGWLARLSFSPENRHFFYPLFEHPHQPAMVALGVAILAAVIAGGVMLLRRRSLEGFALTAFFLLCLPYIQLIPFSPPSLVSDRWLALAVWPVTMLIVAVAWRLKPLPRTTLLLVLGLSWGYQTLERPRDWSSFDALVESDVRAYPGYYMPAVYKIVNFQLPKGLRGDAIALARGITDPDVREVMIKIIEVDHAVHVGAAASGDPREAMNLLMKLGSDLDPQKIPDRSKWNTLLYNVWGKGRFTLKNEWEYLTTRFPNDVSVRYNAGLWLLGANYESAVSNLHAAVNSQDFPQAMRSTAYKNYGHALMNSGKLAEAEIPLLAALEQSPPDFQAYCLLSILYKLTNRVGEAVRVEAECRSGVQGEGAAQ